MTTPEAVIFDIGNVLIEWQPERFYDRVIGEDRRRRLFAEVDLHTMNDKVDLGHPFTETIYATAEAYPEWRAEIRMWHDHWLELASPVIDHSLRLMKALQGKGVPVYCLTNFGIGSFEFASGHYAFLKDFDRHYVSGHMGVIKPDPRIYQMVEEDCGIPPDRLAANGFGEFQPVASEDSEEARALRQAFVDLVVIPLRGDKDMPGKPPSGRACYRSCLNREFARRRAEPEA